MNKKKITIILLIIFFIGMVLSLIYLIYWFNNNSRVNNIMKEEEKKLIITDNNYSIDKSLFDINKYTIGWIIINGTNINYPVVKYTDNDYYLNHDFYNDYNDAGWIFMDFRNNLDDQNLVIYGHNRHDDIMFGDIDKLFDKNFYDNNKNEIIFITKDNYYIYKIFSVYSVDSNDKYINTNFEDFNSTINKFISRSEINFNENVDNTKQIITLSTCHNNNLDRLVIHGYKND